MSSSSPLLFAMASLVLIAGCGRESGITVHFEESLTQPPPGPVHGSPPPPAPATPRQVAQPSAVPTSTPTPAAPPAMVTTIASAEKPPAGFVGHGVAVYLTAPFFPRLTVSFEPLPDSTGAVAVQDLASPDGFGGKQLLSRMRPGRYSLSVTSGRLANFPLHLSRDVVVDGDAGTALELGWVQFDVDPKAAAAIDKSIELELQEAGTGRRVYKGPMSGVAIDVVGAGPRPRSLVLPLGTYAFALRDLDPGDAVKIEQTRGTPGLVELSEANRFSLTRKRPGAIVDLKSALVLD